MSYTIAFKTGFSLFITFNTIEGLMMRVDLMACMFQDYHILKNKR